MSSVTRYTYFPSSYTCQRTYGWGNQNVLPELPFCTSITKEQTGISREVALGMLPHPRIMEYPNLEGTHKDH